MTFVADETYGYIYVCQTTQRSVPEGSKAELTHVARG
jgi:hypothetical protein